MQKGREKFLEVQARMADFQKAALGFQGPGLAHLEMKRRQAGWGLGLAQPDIPEGLSIINVRVVQYRDFTLRHLLPYCSPNGGPDCRADHIRQCRQNVVTEVGPIDQRKSAFVSAGAPFAAIDQAILVPIKRMI